MAATGISGERLGALRTRELERFEALRPRGTRLLREAAAWLPNGVPMTWMASVYDHPPVLVAEGRGSSFTDVDGNAHVDFNLADTSMFGGYGDEAVARAVAERMAAGAQFLLPTEDAAVVARSSRAGSACRVGSSRCRRRRPTWRRCASSGRRPAAAR